MAATESDWEPVPKYSDLLRSIVEFLEKTYQEIFIEKREPHPIELTWRYYNFSNRDILFVVLLSIAWTILRHLATEWVFKPLSHHYALTPTNQRKMPESAWKFVFYLSAWCYTCYVVILSGRYRFFQQPSTVWHNWTLNEPPPGDIYFMYMAQCGFYFHSLYATLFMDTWRKDSFVMMVHHVLTLMLISFSYSLRYHNIGCLVLFLHDVCDISLEFTKLNVYFKIQGNTKKQRHEIMANISFFCFTVTWSSQAWENLRLSVRERKKVTGPMDQSLLNCLIFIFCAICKSLVRFVARLYWYPLRVLYSATADVQKMQLILPCALLMNSLLWILQLLNIYWFLFIVQFLYRVATGQVKEIDDTREYDVEEKITKEFLSRSSNHNLQNGIVKTNGSCDGNVVLNGEVDGIRNRAKKES